MVQAARRFRFFPKNIYQFLVYAAFGIGGAWLLVSLFSSEFQVTRQYDAIAVWQNNSEGNWDIAYSIYQRNGGWMHLPDRDMYYEGNANLIAKLPGDDIDPDISSSRHTAIAVWSNNSDGDYDIYYSFWGIAGWQNPVKLFDFEGDDVDPTVYVQDPDNILVVWVNRLGEEKALYYSRYSKGNWSGPQKVTLTRFDAVAAPELGYITVPSSKYLLVFTAKSGEKGRVYIGVYNPVQGWSVEEVSTPVDPVVDEALPSRHQTSASMQTASGQVTVSWNGSDGKTWYAKIDPTQKVPLAQSGDMGRNPVVAYPVSGSDTLLFWQGGSVKNVTPVWGNNLQIVSKNEPDTPRIDAAYFIDANDSMITVWDTRDEGGGEIYFSVVDAQSQTWKEPQRIDANRFPGDDRNPAVAPILIQWSEENVVSREQVVGDVYCGDSVLQKSLGEECEVGIACKKKTQQCDWDIISNALGPGFAALFADCGCENVIEDEVKVPPKKGKNVGQTVVFGGFSCGFNKLEINRLNNEEVQVKMSPPAKDTPKEGLVFSKTAPYEYSVVSQTGTVAIFPGADAENQPQAAVFLKFVPSDDLNEAQKIVLKGIQPDGFQLCVGEFERGGKPLEGGLVPAPAEGADLMVPEL